MSKRNVRRKSRVNSSQRLEKKTSTLQKQKKKQGALINELIDTEINYVEMLGIGITECHDEFKDPVRKNALPPVVQEKNDVLFANYEDIYHFHLDVFQSELLESKDSIQKIANCFIKKKNDIVSLYSIYCNYRHEANQILKELKKKHPDFLNTCHNRLKKKVEQRLGGSPDTTLATFLILPVQRCMKYKLILQSLLEKTSPENFPEDAEILDEAISCMEEVVRIVNMNVNEVKKKHPETIHDKYIQYRFKKHKKRGFNVFGIDLLMLANSTSSQVPYIVRTLTGEIDKRLNISKDLYLSKQEVPSCKVDRIRLKFELNYRLKADVDLSSEENTHVLCSTLKQFFDELPTPLIPGHMYKDIIDIAMNLHYSRDINTAVTRITETLGMYLNHGPYTRTLNVLLRHLDKIGSSNFKPQSIRDLARVWSPIIFKNPDARFPMPAGCFDHELLTLILYALIRKRKNILWRGIQGVTKWNYNSTFLTSQTYIGEKEVQKYFCLPFIYKDDLYVLQYYKTDGHGSQSRVGERMSKKEEAKRGWLFMHYDGEKVVRQIELHPGRKPKILYRGKHDDSLCKCPLKESKLLDKHNAEISSWDFNTTWRKYGGDSLFMAGQK